VRELRGVMSSCVAGKVFVSPSSLSRKIETMLLSLLNRSKKVAFMLS
jgi:hypothetical protein